MKIGINTFGCDSKSGIGSYLLNFISYLPQNTDISFELFGLEKDKYTYNREKDIPFNSINIHDNPKKIRRWNKHKLNKFVKKNRYDIVLFPEIDKAFATKFKKYTGVAVINGIVSCIFKNCKKSQIHQIKKGLNRIQKIIAVSEVIKQDLIRLGISESKIKVIPNGINHKLFFPSDSLIDDIVDVKPFAIKRPYFVYGSTLSNPEKKHIELIKAFNLFKKNTGSSHRLVIAGNDGLYSEQVHKEAYNSEYASDIFITGYFPYESFPKLYAGADACVFPSVSEGSGLPVLEAFACGIPVVCSNEGVFKEITGDAAVHINSNDIEQMASTMQEIVENKTLRENKISEGLKIASEFNWESTVKNTIDYLKN